mmetsp:Transcript_12365/g.34720  ORF Transcript_12365/g.34720 Transcript_12365/m.34720 type:complete len:449 (-) Transcript_12365:305-1651(-)
MDVLLKDMTRFWNKEIEWNELASGIGKNLEGALKSQSWWNPSLLKSLQEPKAVMDGLSKGLQVDSIKNPVISFMLLRQYSLGQPNSLHPADGAPAEAPAIDDHKLAESTHFLRASTEVYKENPEAAGIASRDVLLNNMADKHVTCDPSLPRHAIYVDHLTTSVVLAIRGTQNLQDVIVDVSAAPAPILGGRAEGHKGIAATAEEMIPVVLPVISGALQRLPGYRLVITGHSLGAGVGSMIALCLRHDADKWGATLPADCIANLTVYSFAPPPLLTPLASLSASDTKNIYVFVNNLDIIPRCTLRNLEILVNVLKKIDAATSHRDPMLLMKAAVSMAEFEVSEKVADEVLQAVQEANKEAHGERAEEKEWLHEQLYHPGQILHLYPHVTSDPLLEERFRLGLGFSVAEGYRLQRLSPDMMARIPVIEGESFVTDHLTENYSKAVLRLCD